MNEIEIFKNKLSEILKKFRKKINFFRRNNINIKFFKEIKFFKKLNLVVINKKNKTFIIAKNKLSILSIESFLKKNFNLDCKVNIKEISLEIENLQFRDGNEKIIKIIITIHNEFKIYLRNLMIKEKKIIKFNNKEERKKLINIIENEKKKIIEETENLKSKKIHEIN